MFADIFIKRPVLSTVCSLLIILAGAIAIPTLPIARYPELAPPGRLGDRHLHRRQRADRRERRDDAARAGHQRRRGHDLHDLLLRPIPAFPRSPSRSTFRVTRTWRPSTSRTASTRRSAACPPTCGPTVSSVTKVTAGFMGGLGFYSRDNRYTNQFISNYLDLFVRDAIKRVPGVGDVIIFGERRYAMRLWLDPGRLAARKLTAGDVLNALREQNVQVAAGALGDQPAEAGQMFTMSVRAVGRLTEVEEFENVVVQTGAATARWCACATWAAWSWARNSTPRTCGSSRSRRPAWASRCCRRPTRWTVYQGVHGDDGAARAELPAGAGVAARLRQRQRRPRVDHRGAQDAGRGHRPRHHRDVPVPPELAQHGDSGDHDSRSRSSAPSRSSSCSTSRSTR